MSFFRDVKKGAGLGLGGGFAGRIGWELGGLVWRLMRRAALALLMIAGGSLAYCQHADRMAQQPPAAVKAVPAKQSPKIVDKAGDSGRRSQ